MLDDVIEREHPVRLLDEILGKLSWDEFKVGYKINKLGQPPIPPKILVGMLILGVHRGVTSSRKLEYQLQNNLEFMWLAHGHQVDHSTIAGFRQRHRKAIKNVHRQVVNLAKQLGVVKLAELYIDGTRIKADANRSKTLTAAKATALLEQMDSELQARLEEMDRADEVEDLFDVGDEGERLPESLRDLQQRRAKLKELIEQLQQADAERKKQGTDPKKNPSQVSVTDPDSRILPNKEGGYAPNYTPVIAVEGELGLVVSTTVIASPNEQDELIGIVNDVEETYGVTVETVAADAAYSIVTNVVEMNEQGKNFLSPDRRGDAPEENPAEREDPSEPVAADKVDALPINPATKKFDQAAFHYDAEQDVHYCPQGRKLHRIGTENVKQRSGKTIKTTVYQCEDCGGCPLYEKCRRGDNHVNPRRVRRDEHEEVRRAHRKKMSDPKVKAAYGKRFDIGEKPFGQIKHNFGLRRFRTRGQPNVEAEWGLWSAANNMLRLAKHIGSVEALRTLLGKVAPQA